MIPKNKEEKTIYQLWKRKVPCYKYLKALGCLAQVMTPLPRKMKIGSKTVDCILIGYTGNIITYRKVYVWTQTSSKRLERKF